VNAYFKHVWHFCLLVSVLVVPHWPELCKQNGLSSLTNLSSLIQSLFCTILGLRISPILGVEYIANICISCRYVQYWVSYSQTENTCVSQKGLVCKQQQNSAGLPKLAANERNQVEIESESKLNSLLWLTLIMMFGRRKHSIRREGRSKLDRVYELLTKHRDVLSTSFASFDARWAEWVYFRFIRVLLRYTHSSTEYTIEHQFQQNSPKVVIAQRNSSTVPITCSEMWRWASSLESSGYLCLSV
jgi:hypothetical protein